MMRPLPNNECKMKLDAAILIRTIKVLLALGIILFEFPTRPICVTAMAPLKFPLKIKNVTDDDDKIIKKYYKGYTRRFIRVGPEGYVAPAGLQDHITDIYNTEVRPDDIWVTSFSRSGTTWLQELVWLVANNLDFETASSVSVSKRFAYIEFPTQNFEVRSGSSDAEYKLKATFDDFSTLPDLPSPRFVKSHLPLSHLPPKLIDTAKVFYIARDPRDVAVSWHFAHKLFRYFDDEVEIKEFWELFKKDLLLHMPIFPHIKEAWQRRNHPNILFLFYEEMKKDILGSIDKVCEFLGREYSTEQKQKLADYIGFDNMKKNTFTRPGGATKDESEITFIRKGKSGNWVKYFDEEMIKEAEEYMAENLSKTDMRFPIVKDD